MTKQTVKLGKNALVIGASMAGLLTARVLSDHYEQVTLLERDTFPAPGENRKGVPQGKHTHVLLERGRQIMENYLPGLTDELTRLGAVPMTDVSLQTRWFHSGGYHQPGVSDIAGVGVSRPTLETAVRNRVLALPNVAALENCNVLGLLTTADYDQVTGVRLMNRQGDDAEETMTADLVVDAGGRGSRSPTWLEELGYDRPAEEEVRIDMGYTTRYYRRQPDHISGLAGIVFLATPPNKRLAVMLAQDDNRWVVTIGGYLGDHVPADEQAFLEAAKRLPTTDIYEVIKAAEPVSEPVAYKFHANLRRRYDKLARFPTGYLILGDALCSFNPIYGQGMTVAALEAVALDECLTTSCPKLAKRFFAQANKIVDLSWNAAVGNDLGYPEVEGPRSPLVRFLNWYFGKLHLAAQHDAQVSIAFLKVINMVAPPPTVLHPGIIGRVIKGNLWPQQQKAGLNQEQPLPQPESIAANR
jgi:2-polyprenyl-6-methoxyphenol hydroxylase-like FAD-dependent oxidoreductase